MTDFSVGCCVDTTRIRQRHNKRRKHAAIEGLFHGYRLGDLLPVPFIRGDLTASLGQ
jgi:hypothetical protein